MSNVYGAEPTLTTPAVTNLGANSATLILQSNAAGTGYFTLLSGSNAVCGNGVQTKDGQDSTGSPAFRLGSLSLTANTPGSYTVRNLMGNTPYTVCFTADNSGASLQQTAASANLTTTAATTYVNPLWTAVGSAGFSAASALSTSLAFAPDGTPYVAYFDGANNDKVTVMKYNGSAWITVGSAGFSSGVHTFTSLALAFAPDGMPYVACADYLNGAMPTVMKYNGTAWVVVGSAGLPADVMETSLAFAPDGTPYVAFSSYFDDSGFYKATVMKFNGTEWILVGNAGFSSGQIFNPSLAFASDGTPYVAYADGSIGYKTTVMRYNGTAWVVVGSAGFSAEFIDHPSLAFAPDGTPYVAYADGSNGYKATLMQYSAGFWSTVGTSDSSGCKTSLAFAPDGTPYVAYSDCANSDKVSVMKCGTGPCDLVGNANFSAGGTDYLSLAFAADGTPYVGFSDGGKATVMQYSSATSVSAVNRLTPTATVTDAATVTYRITFADPVSGVTSANFDLSPTISGAAITGVSAVDTLPTTQWDVTVATGSADGSLVLRLVNSGGISLGIAPTLPYAGQAYTIDRTPPAVSIGAPAASQVLDNAVDYVVTYADPNFSVSTLTAADVILNATGTASGTLTVSGTGTSRIVTMSSISGSGTLGISLAAATATDLAGNSAPAVGPGATFNVPLPSPPMLAIPLISNLGAGSVTLGLQSSATGTGYFTLLPGSNATCGAGPQTKAGQDSQGKPAFRNGSLPLMANTPAYYTMRNLTQSTPYTVCFTAEDTGLALQAASATTSLTTTAESTFSVPHWREVGSNGLSTSGSETSLAFAPDGTPYVAFFDSANSYRATVMKFSGDVWRVVGNAGFSASYANYLSLVFAPDGTPYVAFIDPANGSRATVMKFSGDVWRVVGNAGFSASYANYLSLAFAPDGTPYVAYADSGNDDKTTVMRFSGGSWAVVGNVGFSASYANYLSLAFAPDGTPHVAYADSGTSGKATVMRFSGGSWIAVGSAGFSVVPAASTFLAFAPDGTPYVAYLDNYISSGGKATVMKFIGGDWTMVGNAVSLAEGDFALSLSLAFAPDGNPYIAYDVDTIYPGRAMVMKFSAGDWTTVGSAGFSAGRAAYPSLTFAPDGTPYVAYADVDSSFKATVVRLDETAPSATTGSASSVTATGVILNGTVNDNGIDTTIFFDYGLSATPYSDNILAGSVTAGSGATPVSAPISGLSCNTTYHFRISASNAAVSVNGNDATFTTSACLTQTINFGTAPAVVVGGTGTVSATGGGSGNPVTFSSLTPTVCTTNGASVTGVAVGTCTIAADQAGTASYAAAQQATQSFTINPNAATLTVSLLGSGGGSVNNTAPLDAIGAISCVSGSSSGCSHTFTSGDQVTLAAVADSKSSFDGWGPPCSGTGNCIITLTGNTDVSVAFTVIPRIRIPGPTPVDFASLQDAYDHAISGDSLSVKVYTFTENLLLNRDIVVTIDGGRSDDFSATVGVTTLTGSLTLERGALTVNYLSLE